MFEWTYSGVNLSLEGTGGKDCVNYLPLSQLLLETAFISVMSVLYVLWAWNRIKLPYNLCYRASHGNGRRVLLLLHGVTFGVEIGFKCATNSLIWVLNPCHMITTVQLILLTAPCTPLTTALFRMQVHMINGPLVALVFPVVNTRLLQFEQLVYYVQHILIVVVPMYLMKSEGMFSVEPLWDMSYAVLSLGLQSMYHFWVLQYISYTTTINLDNILCPAISDPFNGPNYRKWAVLHQTLLILLHGKLLTLLSDLIIFRFYSNETFNKQSLTLDDPFVQQFHPSANTAKNPPRPTSQDPVLVGAPISKPDAQGDHQHRNNKEAKAAANGDLLDYVISVSNPDEAYSYNHLEIRVQDRFFLDLLLDQSDTIHTRSFKFSRSNSLRSEKKFD